MNANEYRLLQVKLWGGLILGAVLIIAGIYFIATGQEGLTILGIETSSLRVDLETRVVGLVLCVLGVLLVAFTFWDTKPRLDSARSKLVAKEETDAAKKLAKTPDERNEIDDIDDDYARKLDEIDEGVTLRIEAELVKELADEKRRKINAWKRKKGK